jgi:hypothetical protein
MLAESPTPDDMSIETGDTLVYCCGCQYGCFPIKLVTAWGWLKGSHGWLCTACMDSDRDMPTDLY